MSDSVQALVLDDSVTRANAEPIHFAGFPGLWLEGHPVAVSELGFGEDVDVYALVDELGLPLAETKVAAGEGLMPEVANHVRAGELPVSIDDGDVETIEAPPPPDPFADSVALKAEELIPAIQTSDDLDWLNGLEASERSTKARTTVLTAIAERRDELAAAAAAGEAGS